MVGWALLLAFHISKAGGKGKKNFHHSTIALSLNSIKPIRSVQPIHRRIPSFLSINPISSVSDRLLPPPQSRSAARTAAIRSYAVDAKAAPTEVSSILEQRIRGVQDEANLAETGRVLSVGYVLINPPF